MSANSSTRVTSLRALGCRYWIDVLLWLTLTGILVGAVNLGRDIGHPFGGYMVLDYVNTNEWVVDGATPPWWSALGAGGLRIEDRLRAIDGNSDILNQGNVYAAAVARGNTEVEVQFERAGQVSAVRLPILTFSLRHLIEFKLPDVIIGLSFWLLALIVYRLRPADPLNRTYAVLGALIAVLLASWRLDLFERTADFGPWLRLPELLRTAAPLIAPTVLYAIMLLTTEDARPPKSPVYRRWLKAGYLIAGMTTLLWWSSRFLLWHSGWSPLVGWLDEIPYRIGLAGGVVCIVIGLLRIVHTLRSSTVSARVKRRVTGLLFGVAIAFPMMVMNYRAGLFLSGSNFCCGGLDLRYLYLAVPLAFAFVILRYQTFRGIDPAFLGVLVLSSSALLASVGDWLIRRSSPALNGDISGAAFQYSAAAVLQAPPFVWLLVVVLMGSAVGLLLPQWLSRLFRWEDTSYSAARQFGQRMLHRLDLASLPDEMVTALASALQLDRVALWLWQPGIGSFNLASSAGVPMDSLPHHLAPSPGILERPAYIGADAKSVAAWLRPLQTCGFEAVAPLNAPGIGEAPDRSAEARVGLLALGKRVDEEIFHTRDLEIIELIAQQAALFLLTAQQIERLREVPRRVTEAQERERFRLAQELHDTIQQFLGRLPFYLQVSRTSVRSRPEQTETLLQRCIADVESAAQTVRQIRGELAPIQLESKLTQPLVDLLERFRARTNLVVQAEIAADVDARLAPAARHALYRVIQQALDNVDVHARGATSVAVVVRSADRQVQFSVTDDGPGFTEAQRVQAEAAGHFGLRSMQARINSLGGELTVTSGADSGVVVQGWLPSS